jgi:hypothetical protein
MQPRRSIRHPVTFGFRQQLLVPLASDLKMDIWMDQHFSSSRGRRHDHERDGLNPTGPLRWEALTAIRRVLRGAA